MKRLFPHLLMLPILAVTLFSTTPARAGAIPFSERPVWIGLGGAGGASGIDPSAVGYFQFTLGLRFFPVVPEFTLRQGLRGKAEAQTQLGGVALGARFLLPKLLIARGYLRAAFSQQHEVDWEHFLERPMGTLFGVDDGLTHRSGFEGGGGVELSLGPKGIVGLWLQGTVLIFPTSPGPPVTTIVEAGISFALGPRLGGG